MLGGATMVLATIRFRRTTRDIEVAERRSRPGTSFDIALVTLLLLLGTILFVYLIGTVIGRP